MATIPITKRGAEKLKAELHELKTVQRPWVINAIADATALSRLLDNRWFSSKEQARHVLDQAILALDPCLPFVVEIQDA